MLTQKSVKQFFCPILMPDLLLSILFMHQVGDRVGVVRKPDGTVHFFVNGIDQGACATCVPANVYGVIDLYGMAAEATIVDQTGEGQSTLPV